MKRPTGVTIIAILAIIVGALGVLGGVLGLAGGALLAGGIVLFVVGKPNPKEIPKPRWSATVSSGGIGLRHDF